MSTGSGAPPQHPRAWPAAGFPLLLGWAAWVLRAGGLSDEDPPLRAGTEPTDTIVAAAADTMLVTQVQVGDTAVTCGGSPPSCA